MHGDFSERQRLIDPNFAGVLYQQGRVFIDSDGNAQTRITNHWQDTAARDAFGADVAAVPADAPASFRIDGVAAAGAGQVDLSLQPGRCWADGLLVHMQGAAPVHRLADYLTPPVQPLPVPLAPAAGDRDAVILDVWRESLSAFQQPDDLIEPALGGPDTTERVLTSYAFKLLRLVAGDTCTNLSNKIDDHFNTKGHLTVSLQPVVVIGGDCPVVDSGGYTGFEHSTFRIEIARLADGAPKQFMWSSFNGGLVGRGRIDPARPGFVEITANHQPIITSGLTSFYLEVRAFDPARGHWVTTYGGQVTLTNNNDLQLPAAATFGALPGAGPEFFFRLWNGLRPIAGFPPGANNPLVDGIRLNFQADAVGRYTAGDYWTFTVRADGVAPNAGPILLNNALPEGVHHHRVCLGVITWGPAPAIEDCRHVFQPLTKLKGCCTYRVGDGMHSFGDFNTIQAAVLALPPEGGEICLLSGVFRENVLIRGKQHVHIHGCGFDTRVIGPPAAGGAAAAPVFQIEDSRDVTLERFAIEAAATGPGILLAGLNTDPLPIGGVIPRLREITLQDLRITAAERSAIQGSGGQFITVRRCDVRMTDVRGSSPAIFLTGDDMEIEHNQLRVRSARQVDDGPTLAIPVSTGLGGLQIGGTSERVRIIDNWIQGGRGNGITLGSVVIEHGGGGPGRESPGWVIDRDDPCDPCRPGTTRLPDPDPGGGGSRVRSAGALYDIRIERNRIFDMGMNGIGVIAFFNLDVTEELITVVRLEILGNEIRHCLRRGIVTPDDAVRDSIGYGAIQLSDVVECTIRGNVLNDNGPSHIPAVCGIYVFHAEGLDITDNHIVNNGAKTGEPDLRAESGARAGIYVALAIAPTVLMTVDAVRRRLPVQNGVPALKVHDNVVSQPLGHALFAIALGPVSVQDNQLASQGNVLRLRPLSMTFIAATVFILDLGMSLETRLYFAKFSYASSYLVREVAAPEMTDFAALGETLDDRLLDGRLGRVLAGGNVMFVNNQVTLDMQAAGFGFAITSITILTLDDLAFEDNQCECNLIDDFVLTNAALAGVSVRAIGNRFKEGRFNAYFSALTVGVPLNGTSQNQATHCILAESSDPNFLVFSDNRMLWGPMGFVANTDGDGCQRYMPKG